MLPEVLGHVHDFPHRRLRYVGDNGDRRVVRNRADCGDDAFGLVRGGEITAAVAGAHRGFLLVRGALADLNLANSFLLRK